MSTPDILSICFSAFLAVFMILSGLAILMTVIITLFPIRGSDKEDLAVYSVIASVHSSIYPGTKITKIEEVK